MIYLLKGYLAYLTREIIHTAKQADPETLTMAMAARPGALDKANIVGSSLIQVAKALFPLHFSEESLSEALILLSGHVCLKVVHVRREKCGE